LESGTHSITDTGSAVLVKTPLNNPEKAKKPQEIVDLVETLGLECDI
jgi:hypothetical protein